MAPNSRVILCRHSQAEHNVDLDYSIPDAPLTPLGKKQSAALAPQIPKLQQEVDVIISSALKRTLQSTKLGWGPAVERLGIQNVICLPQAQECNDFPCDTGSPREHLESLDEFKDFNLELLTPDWTSKKGFYAPDPASIANRARWVRQYIRGRKEATIVLVAHGDILRQITSTEAGPSTYQWKNAEVREYSFDSKTVDGEDCFLYQENNVAHAGGYEATSTEMDIAQHKSAGATTSNPEEGQEPALSEPSDTTERSPKRRAASRASTSRTAAPTGEHTSPPPTQPPGMLDPAHVAQDPTVFTPEGRIVFHRSDGDPSYVPPNIVVPPVSDSEVNYYHIFTRDEAKWVSWSKSIAQKLAVDYFHLPPKAPNLKDWALQDFPTDYCMTEQRKGLRKTYRTDPYLFGSAAHRFRSTMEFLPHAFWLLTDPSMNTSNCRCKYCSGTVRGGGGGGGGSTSGTSAQRKSTKPWAKLPAQTVSRAAAAYRTARNNYKIRAQATPREHQLPGVPLAIYSSKERNDELEAVETGSFGPCEGFRIGEIAYCRLQTPITSEEDEGCQITAWPVMIEGVTFQVDVDRNGQDSTDRASFDLRGRVHQKRMYQVTFMPTHEKGRVEQDRLIPGLMMFPLPTALQAVPLGCREDHAWIQNRTPPELNLEYGKSRPGFKEILFCYLYSVDIFKQLRLFYTATDQFTRAEMGRKAVSHLATADANEATREPAAPWLTDPASAGPSVESSSSSVANRFLQATVQNNYMDLDNDDQSSRRRAALRGNVGKPGRDASSSSSFAAAGQVASPLDNNRYWQGMLFGLERIWVGDLVRLRLSVEDVETMMTSLAMGNDLYNAEDRTKPDTSSCYVLRIKAIYRAAKAEVTQTDDKIRVAGDVFRVIDLAEVEPKEGGKEGKEMRTMGAREDDEVEFVAKREQTDSLDDAGASAAQGRRHGGIAVARPTFEVPFRPFLEKAYEERLPMTPSLPPGFGFQRVNQSSVEVVCSVQQLAGRLWCSFAEQGDDQRAREERRKPYLAHEDTQDVTRLRLSMTGLIAGAVKAMEVHPNEGHFNQRERAIATASTFALKAQTALLLSKGTRSEDEAGEQQDLEDTGTGSGSAFASASGGGQDGDRAMPKEGQIGDQHGQPAATPVEAEPDGSDRATKRIRIDEGKNVSEEGGQREEVPASASATSVAASNPALASLEQARPESPPLPAFWIKKSSRSGQGVYYANIKTKQTRWDRPTA